MLAATLPYVFAIGGALALVSIAHSARHIAARVPAIRAAMRNLPKD